MTIITHLVRHLTSKGNVCVAYSVHNVGMTNEVTCYNLIFKCTLWNRIVCN